MAKFLNDIIIQGEDFNTSLSHDPCDISTWQIHENEISVGAQEANPEAIFFKSDGTKMYVAGRSGDDVNEYALSTAWDITTASFTDTLSGLGGGSAGESNPYGMYISPDGIYFYLVGHTTDQVIQYTMSTAWDISTASYTREQDLLIANGNDFADPIGINFKSDGTMFWVVSQNSDAIQQYTLSTPWDISTLSVGHFKSLTGGFFTLIPIDGTQNNYSLGAVEDIWVSEDGTKVWLPDSSFDTINQLKLSTPFDVTTATYDGCTTRVSYAQGDFGGIYVNETVGKAFTCAPSGDWVRSWDFGGLVFNNDNEGGVGFLNGVTVKGDIVNNGLFNQQGRSSLHFADVYSTFTTYGTSSLAHSNGGTVNIVDNTTYTGLGMVDMLTNVRWGRNNNDQNPYTNGLIHNINFGRPREGAIINLNIGRRQTGNTVTADSTGIMNIVSKAQTFTHDGYLTVGQKLQVTGNADLQAFDLGGTVIFNDTFTETNTTDLASHTPDTGAGWTKVFDSGTAQAWNVTGGAGVAQVSVSDSSDGMIYLCDTLPTVVDYEIKVDFLRRDSSDDTFHIIFKYKDANNFFYLSWSASYSSYCRLRKKEGGSFSDIATFDYGVFNSTADNTASALKVRFIDNKIMIWDIDTNGYQAYRGSFDVTDFTNDGNGGTFHKFGMGIGAIDGGSHDQTTTWKIDKFEVKQLSSAATLANSTQHYILNGNVGIGTTDPAYARLQVAGTTLFQGASQIQGDLSLRGNVKDLNKAGGAFLSTRTRNTSGSELALEYDYVKSFNATNGGDIGIGTTSPDSIVHIKGTTDGTDSGADAILHVEQDGGWSGNEPWALYVQGYSYLNGFRINAADGIRALHKVDSGGQLGFSVTDTAPITFTQSNSAERMRVHTNGFIGIGTASPDLKLDVTHATGGEYVATFQNTTANLELKLGVTSTNYLNIQGQQINNSAAYNMSLQADGGNVGIGTVTPSKTLTVSGTAQVTGEAFFGNFDNISNNSRMRNDLKLWYNTDRTFGVYGNASKIAVYGNSQDMLSFDTSSNATFAGKIDTNSGPNRFTHQQNAGSRLELYNNRQDAGNVEVYRIAAYNSAEVAGVHFYRGSNGNSGYTKIFAKKNNASSLEEVVQFGTNDALTTTFAGAVTMLSGTSGTTSKLTFKRTDNSSVATYIRTNAYWNEYSSHQNEGHKFVDSNSSGTVQNTLLQLNGSLNSSGNGALSATFAGSVIAGAFVYSERFRTTVAGTESFAAIYMNSDSNSGLFQPAADSLGFTTAGATALTLDSSQNATFAGVVKTANGSATTPAYNFSSHDGNGMYLEEYDASNNKEQVSIATDGVRRFRANEAGIWSDQNVYFAGQLRKFGEWVATSGTSGQGFRFANTADTIDVLTITSAGNATFAGSISSPSIITTDTSNSIPSANVITNKILSQGYVAANGNTRTGLDVETNRRGWYNSNATAGNFKVSSFSTGARIGASDLIGVKSLASFDTNNTYSGVSAQGSLTALYGKVTTTFTTGSSPIANGYGLRIDAPEVAANSEISTYYGAYIDGGSVSGTLTNKYALVTEANAGNVGIGTTSPSQKLEVSGNVKISDSAGPYLNLYRDDNIINSGNHLGSIVFGGGPEAYQESPLADSAIVLKAEAAGDAAANNAPSKLTIQGVNDNSAALSDWLVLSNGNATFAYNASFTGNITANGNITGDHATNIGAINRVSTKEIAINNDSSNTTLAIANVASSTVRIGKLDTETAGTNNNDGTNVIVENHLTVEGKLTVKGDVVTESTSNTVIKDNIIQLNGAVEGSTPSANTSDIGVVMDRGTSNSVALQWDESAGLFQLVATGSDAGSASLGVIAGGGDNQDENVAGTANAAGYQTLYAGKFRAVGSAGTSGFTGDGSALTALNGSEITTGTVAVARGGTGLTSISTLLNSNVTSVSGNAGSVTNGVYTTGDQNIAGNKSFSGVTSLDGCVVYSMSSGQLTTTGYACAGLSSATNGSSALFTFECGGSSGNSYQRIVYNCHNDFGTWNTTKCVDEGGNKLDVVASANGSTITFTFKGRSSTQNYSPRVMVKAVGHGIVKTYT